jgi:nickel-dependent lactate racemase
LADLVHRGNSVVIVHTDITRPTPNDRILPIIIAELERSGIHSKDITLLNGLGTHRKQTPDELRKMLGEEIFDHYRCFQHNGRDDSQLISLGFTKLGHPVRVNRTYLEADVRILTGFIEPHCAAGFSGGPKAVLPSLAGAESVATNHGYEMIGHPKATWGITEGNPIWEEMREVALLTRPTFLLNITLNNHQEITGIFAGNLLEAHRTGSEFVREHAMVGVEKPYDIVITTNNGYPADLNLYQSMKGVSAAAQIVRQDGTIILAAACEEGVPIPSGYADLVMGCDSPQAILSQLSQPGFAYPEQWEAQMQAMIQQRADIYVYSDGLDDDEIRRMLLFPCHSIEETLVELLKGYGRQARICVLPSGPQVIPYVI